MRGVDGQGYVSLLYHMHIGVNPGQFKLRKHTHSDSPTHRPFSLIKDKIVNDGDQPKRVDGVVGYRICLTHRRSSVRTWVDSIFFSRYTIV